MNGWWRRRRRRVFRNDYFDKFIKAIASAQLFLSPSLFTDATEQTLCTILLLAGWLAIHPANQHIGCLHVASRRFTKLHFVDLMQIATLNRFSIPFKLANLTIGKCVFPVHSISWDGGKVEGRSIKYPSISACRLIERRAPIGQFERIPIGFYFTLKRAGIVLSRQ